MKSRWNATEGQSRLWNLEEEGRGQEVASLFYGTLIDSVEITRPCRPSASIYRPIDYRSNLVSPPFNQFPFRLIPNQFS